MTFEEWWNEYSADRDWPWRIRGAAHEAWHIATEAERERCASRALAIVNAILEDLTDRRGLRHEWNQIEPEIQIEIMIAWKDATVAAIREAPVE